MRQTLRALLLASLVVSSQALAQETRPSADFAARHFTTNALDGPVAIADGYTALRGSIVLPFAHERGSTTLSLSMEGRHHDRIRIRNAASGAASLQTTLALSDRLELRGTVGIAGASDGDHLQVENLIIGTRTPRRAVNAGIEAGLQVTPDTTLLAELSGIAEDYGLARFEDEILLPAQLEPDRKRLRAAAGIRRTFGRHAAGLSAAIEQSAIDRVGDPPLRLSARTLSLEAVGTYAGEAGRTLEFGVGAQHLSDDDGLFAEWRPSLRASMALPLSKVELRGSVRLGYETVDTDDPLGSWLGRAELAAAFPLAEKLVFAAGIFAEKRQNLLLENEETRTGLHGEFTFAAAPRSDLVLRLDYARSKTTILDVEKDRLDLLIGIRTRL